MSDVFLDLADRRIAAAVKERTVLHRAWRAWHRERRDAVLAGPHGAMFERLLYILKNATPQSQPLLLGFIRGIDWSSADETTRYVVLHEIGHAVVALRERDGLAPFDDPLPGERENVFRLIKQILFPAQAAPPGAQPGLNQRNT
jgi:hypothetical protein